MTVYLVLHLWLKCQRNTEQTYDCLGCPLRKCRQAVYVIWLTHKNNTVRGIVSRDNNVFDIIVRNVLGNIWVQTLYIHFGMCCLSVNMIPCQLNWIGTVIIQYEMIVRSFWKIRLLAASVVGRGFEPRSGQIKNYDIVICCFSAKHATVRRKNNDWLTRNQDDVSEWGDIPFRGL